MPCQSFLRLWSSLGARAVAVAARAVRWFQSASTPIPLSVEPPAGGYQHRCFVLLDAVLPGFNDRPKKVFGSSEVIIFRMGQSSTINIRKRQGYHRTKEHVDDAGSNEMHENTPVVASAQILDADVSKKKWGPCHSTWAPDEFHTASCSCHRQPPSAAFQAPSWQLNPFP